MTNPNLDYTDLLEIKNTLSSIVLTREVVTFSIYDGPYQATSLTTEGDTLKVYQHTDEQKQFIRSVFSKLDPLIKIDFQEAASSEIADIRIFRAFENSEWDDRPELFSPKTVGGGTAYPRKTRIDIEWRDLYQNDKFYPYEKYTIVHEIGHALGLSHPGANFQGGESGGENPNWDMTDSIMSYNSSGNYPEPTFFSNYDLQALQSIWGTEYVAQTSETQIGDTSNNGIVLNGTAKQDYLTGSAGNDVINGFGESDSISGESGDDIIDGGLARRRQKWDQLSGGEGSDIFVVKDGYASWIKDFDSSTDRLDISGLTNGLDWTTRGQWTYILGSRGSYVAVLPSTVDMNSISVI